MLNGLPPPTLVQDARSFGRLMEDLEGQREIAVDTEADSFYSYREKVCLVQITVEDRDYLVDPLAGFDVRPLGTMLADPRRLKVFHDGEYDVLILKRIYGFRFKNLFDTRVAAATLGSPNPGLANVLRERYGIELDKSMQRSDWAQRPLSDKQIRYARLDTRFLLPLMREQRVELASRTREHFVDGECRRLEALEPPDDSFDPDEFVKLKNARLLDPLGRQVLRELFALREELARASDQPHFRVMNNETLVEIARVRPHSVSELQRIPGISPKQGRLRGDGVLEAVRRGIELGPLRKLPQLPNREGTQDFSEHEIELHERLKNRRKELAQELGIDSAYLINRHVLPRIARAKPRTLEALAKTEGLLDWQVRDYGADLLGVVEKFEQEREAGLLPTGRRRGPRRG
ncbi:MAG: HRDC domain-containing protein [Planctomycetes bacterium]|nr:HRDC domain-containing protein [Planctomycetota bacterium]